MSKAQPKPTIAQLLAESRQAHAQGKKAAGDVARDFFQIALERRLQARRRDPKRVDASWAVDALHPPVPGEKTRRYKRLPGLTTEEVAAKMDAELELYYRLQTGALAPTAVLVTDPEIVTPKAWREVTAGTGGLCAQGHTFQPLAVTQRVCQVCGRIDELVELKAKEDTEAFQQLQKERA